MKNLHIKIAAYMSILLMVGCSSPEDLGVQLAKEAVVKHLRDPESAKFYDVFVVYHGSKVKSPTNTPHMCVCGSVDGKNQYGAYGGSTRFVSNVMFFKENKPEVVSTRLEAYDGQDGFFQTWWDRYCNKKTTQ